MILKVRERHTNEVDIYHSYGTAQKMKKSLMENFIFCAMRASKSALSFGNEARLGTFLLIHTPESCY